MVCHGFGWDRVNFFPCSCCVLYLVGEECWEHWSFQLLLCIKDFSQFPILSYWARCAGAGRKNSQTDSPSWPMEIFHTIDSMLSLCMGVGWGGAGQESALLFYVSSNHLFSGSLVFLGSFVKFAKIHEFGVLWLLLGDWLQIGHWGVRKNVYSLFCVFIIIIFSSGSISFVALLNCLYLNPQVSPFVHFSSPSCWRGRRRVSERLSDG